MSTPSQPLAGSVGLLILRVGIGAFMLMHGWGKLEMLLAGNFDQFGDPIGLGKPLSLVLSVLAEVVAAVLVMIGLATRCATIPLIVTMAVAAFVVHGSDPWTMGEGARLFMSGESESWASKEPALLFLIPYLALALIGPGSFSLDYVICARRNRQPAKS